MVADWFSVEAERSDCLDFPISMGFSTMLHSWQGPWGGRSWPTIHHVYSANTFSQYYVSLVFVVSSHLFIVLPQNLFGYFILTRIVPFHRIIPVKRSSSVFMYPQIIFILVMSFLSTPKMLFDPTYLFVKELVSIILFCEWSSDIT